MNHRSQRNAEKKPPGSPVSRVTQGLQPGPVSDSVHVLVEALKDSRSGVPLQAAHTLNHLCKAQPEVLLPHARTLLQAAAACADLRTRWNMISIVGALPLRGRDKAFAVDLLFEALAGGSGFLRAFALTGLANFAREDPSLRSRVRPLIDTALEDPSPAVRARARKLVKQLG